MKSRISHCISQQHPDNLLLPRLSQVHALVATLVVIIFQHISESIRIKPLSIKPPARKLKGVTGERIVRQAAKAIERQARHDHGQSNAPTDGELPGEISEPAASFNVGCH